MTTQDKIKVIAEYDGWVFYQKKSTLFSQGYYRKVALEINRPNPFAPSELKYLTSLDWLHPVAMKVLDGLFVRDLIYNENAKWSRATIRQYCATKPINGEYIDMFNAVYEAIQFLNKSKTI